MYYDKRQQISVKKYTSNIIKRLSQLGIEIKIFNTRNLSLPKYIVHRNFSFLIEAEKYEVDIIHLNDIGPLGLPLLNQGPPPTIKIFNKAMDEIPIVATIHGPGPFILQPKYWKGRSMLRRIIPPLMFRGSALIYWKKFIEPIRYIICISKTLKLVMQKYLNIEPEKLRVAHHGVNPKIFNEKEEEPSIKLIEKNTVLKLKVTTFSVMCRKEQELKMPF